MGLVHETTESFMECAHLHTTPPFVSCDRPSAAPPITRPRPQTETSMIMKGHQKDLPVIFILALLSLVRAQQCNETLAITVDSHEGADTEGCINGTEACRTLDYALEVLASSSCSSLSLTLVSREPPYNLSYNEVNLVGSVIFRSTGGRASVNCITPGYNVNRDNKTIYDDNVTAVLRIKDGESTVLEGVDFHKCQRPIRFENVPRLEIRNCSFR